MASQLAPAGVGRRPRIDSTTMPVTSAGRAARRRARRHGVASPSGTRVGQQIEAGNGNGDEDEQRSGLKHSVLNGIELETLTLQPSSSRLTSFMSSHTSRFDEGLRSRYAGWNVGISFAPR